VAGYCEHGSELFSQRAGETPSVSRTEFNDIKVRLPFPGIAKSLDVK